MYCCFTGHRPEHLPWGSNETDPRCIKLKKLLLSLIEQSVSDGYRNFYCGMARGIDTYAAEAVLSLSEKNPEIQLHAVLPCPAQHEKWHERDRERFEILLEKCSTKTLMSPFYTNTCMLARNRFMVDNSSRTIAVWNGFYKGGTAYTVRYSKSQNKQVYLIRPADSSFNVL